eukprot:scaffold2254_cov393-Prasinococcus_capsulatus_cf.AAC.14
MQARLPASLASASHEPSAFQADMNGDGILSKAEVVEQMLSTAEGEGCTRAKSCKPSAGWGLPYGATCAPDRTVVLLRLAYEWGK